MPVMGIDSSQGVFSLQECEWSIPRNGEVIEVQKFRGPILGLFCGLSLTYGG